MSSFLLFAAVALALALMMKKLMHFEASYSSADIAKLSAGLTVVVTGANSGVGFASADHFVQAGTAKVVVMACRNVHKCDEARDKIVQKSPNSSTKIIPLQLDLANKTSIEKFASILPDRLRELMGEEEGDAIPSIDALMDNAGVFARLPHKGCVEVHTDTLATDCLDKNFAEPSKIVPFVPASQASLTINSKTITRQHAK
jgi:NAD(P)-dependent dehydrogenase (short-subunit alcohol dehydrogenase family)